MVKSIMLGFQDTGKLLKLLMEGEGKILEEVLSEFESTFSTDVKFHAICARDVLLSMSAREPELFAPAQRLIAFAILHRANAYENASSNPLTSILVDAACDEKAEKYERAFILGLLGTSIPPLLKQSAKDYMNIMEVKFDCVSPQFPPHEELLEKYVSKTSKPFNSVFRHASGKSVIPDPDVSKGCNSSSKELENVRKLGLGDKAEAARGVMSTFGTLPPMLPIMKDELLWLNLDTNHELVWDYGMYADTKALKGSVVHEKEELVMGDLADGPKLGEGFGKSEQEKFEDLKTENPNSATTDNPETQVGGLGLVVESMEKTEFPDLPSGSDNEDDECEDQNGVVSTKTSGSCSESSHLVVNGSKSQEEITDAQNEAPPTTSMDSDLELHSTNNKEILEGKGELNNMSSDKNADDATDECESQISPNETFSENLGSSDVGVDAVEFALQEVSTEGQHEANLKKEVTERAELEVPVTISVDSGLESSPANDPKAQIVENKASLEPDSVLETVVCSGKESRFQNGDMQVETEVSNAKGKAVRVPSATVNTKLDHAKARTSFSVTYKKDLLESFNINREAVSNITWGSAKIKFGTLSVEDTGDKSDVNSVISDENLILKENEHTKIHAEDTGDKSDVNPVISDGNLMLKENKHTKICRNNISMASSGTDEVCGEESSIKPTTNPFYYLVRVPRFDVESLKEQIKVKEMLVDEWTKKRDAFNVLSQETKKAIDQTHGVKCKTAKDAAYNARKLVMLKREEIDSIQPKLQKARNAASIQDTDRRISEMEYMIQHESMPLKEEKKLIHEIKQQKQFRKNLPSNMGSQDEIKESLEQKEELEELSKVLWKDLSILQKSAVKAEAYHKEKEREYNDECKKVREPQARARAAANDSRQEAYYQLQSLRKELKNENKLFYKYKDASTAAKIAACNKDSDTLHSLCINQIENFMELWNNNDKFREEYVTFNAKSTVRRFGTLDGRALGPNEERPVILSYVDQKVHKMIPTQAEVDSVSEAPVLELKQERKLDNGNSEEETKKKLTKPKNKAATKDKKAAEPGSTTVSSKDVPVEVEPTKSEEEIRLEKAEEMRRKEDEAKLKEQRRLEELAKAQEARERKKEKEEKDKIRTELKAQKEAEQKEKEREKRLRKKEKKNASTGVPAESNSSIDPPVPENAAETAQEIEQPKQVSTTSKKPQKPPVFRNRNQQRVTQPPPQIRRKRSQTQNPCVIIMGIIAAIVGMIFLYNTYLK